jgi:hypothetical protein
MFVRSTLIVAVFAVNSIIANSQVATAPQHSFSLTLSASQPTVKAGGPMIVNVTVKNISDHMMGVEEDRSYAELSYRVTVLGENGKEAATTAFHRLLRGKPSQGDPAMVINGNGFPVPLDPGKTIVDQIDLSKLYSLGPGVYTVQVERTIDPETAIRSNTIMITVTP